MNLFIIRKYYILTSQLLGICYWLYFIYNVDSYSITWKPLKWLIPGVVNKINICLEQIGTLILIIPLSIIVMNILIPESYKLKIASAFFGTASTIYILISGVLKNTIGIPYN